MFSVYAGKFNSTIMGVLAGLKKSDISLTDGAELFLRSH
jgi:hypothetical protein